MIFKNELTNLALLVAGVGVGVWLLRGKKRRHEKIDYLNLSKLGPKGYSKWTDEEIDFVYELFRRLELMPGKPVEQVWTELEKGKFDNLMVKYSIQLS